MSSMQRQFDVFLPMEREQAEAAQRAYYAIARHADLEADWEDQPTFAQAFPNGVPGFPGQSGLAPYDTQARALALTMYREIVNQLEANFDVKTGDDPGNWDRDVLSVALSLAHGLEIFTPTSSVWASTDVAVGMIRACQAHFGLEQVEFTVHHGVYGEVSKTCRLRVPPPGHGEVEELPCPDKETPIPPVEMTP